MAAKETNCRTACAHCDTDRLINDRLAQWNVAYDTLKARDWEGELSTPCPEDVLKLAKFLIGESTDDG
ncbi:hypothetical protein [Streptomyces sp. NPDC002855]|uniref:hypothetical protein n=1 Tax=Streptomyces sp. NPDC002855 TaxID=3154437 RepID=UPI003320312E